MKLFGIIQIALCVTFVVSTNLTRPGRCPYPQYAFSGLSCSIEGDDSPCPSNYKCCPLTNGMNCFEPCAELAQPCTLRCPFGFKINPSPCTICECESDPCLTTVCPLGTKCITKDYEPCAIPGRCGITTQCIDDPSIQVDPTPKPNNCPDYWPQSPSIFRSCRGPDRLCPGAQKCCQSPSLDFGSSDGASSFCVEPCKDIFKCALQCKWGLLIKNYCLICKCAPDPCCGTNCPRGQVCQALPTPCAFYPGRPPCPLLPACVDATRGRRDLPLH